MNRYKLSLPSEKDALPGRKEAMPVLNEHFVHQRPIVAPFGEGLEIIQFGLGCFWGAERVFWTQEGVYSTAVGYAAGVTPNPSYEEVCSGRTGHNEVVLVAYDPKLVSYSQLLKVFFESHNPTQGMAQGNDVGTQYRSGIYYYCEQQKQQAIKAKQAYQEILKIADFSVITTEIESAGEFYYAEQYHQQYLAKNPNGYCGLGGTGLVCPSFSE